MRTFNMNVNCMPVEIIGFGGENDVTEVICDFGAWAEEFGQGAISLAVRRPSDIDPHLAVLTVDGTAAHWMITDVETSYKGHGEAQWIYTVGEKVKKSAVFGFRVERSLNSDTVDLPEAYQTWFDDLVALGADIHEVAEKVYEATGHYPKIENGYWYLWDVTNETWVNTGQKAQGEEGAPGVGVASTVLNSDYTLTITLTDGTSYTTPSIRGATGNGIASTVLNSDYTLTITFTDGTSYTTPSIRGAQGVPGQDYVITSADYDEIAGRVDTMIAGERQQALDDIDDAKDDAVANVADEGTTQVGLVTEEGTTQVGLVNAKGQEVIESIPSDYSELSADVSELKADLPNKADIIVNSASGAIASFSDGANYPVKQTVFTMNPVQDLHGQDYPYPAGGGKNKIVPLTTVKTFNGVTATCSSETETIILTGTATSSGGRTTALTPIITLPAGTYYFSASAGRVASYVLNKADNTFISGANGRIVLEEETSVYVGINVTNGTTYNETVKIQLEEGSSATAWSPYRNICSILGHTEVDAHRTGNNLWNPDADFPMLDVYYQNGTIARCRGIKLKLPVGTYTFSATKIGVAAYIYINTINSDGSLALFNYWTTNAAAYTLTMTLTEGQYFIVYDAQALSASTAVRFNNYNLQIELGSTASTYEVFNGQSVTYQLGQTVYAGSLTINEDGTGTIVSDMASVDLGTLTWGMIATADSGIYRAYTDSLTSVVKKFPNNVKSTAICSVYKTITIDQSYLRWTGISIGTTGRISAYDKNYNQSDSASAFKTSVTGQQLVYELATPVTINLTEQEVIETLKGQNNVWCNTGDTEVTYRADTKLYIDNKIATLLSV